MAHEVPVAKEINADEMNTASGMYVTEKLPALNTAGDILLVDPTYYLIGDRSGVAIAYSEHYKFVNDQGTWRFVKRVDGQPWVNAAITLQDGTRTVSPFVALAAG